MPSRPRPTLAREPRGRVVGIAVRVLVDAAAATGVEAVDDDQRVDDEEDSEDDGAAGEFHFDALSWVEPGELEPTPRRSRLL
jgi:hypothetical protein